LDTLKQNKKINQNWVKPCKLEREREWERGGGRERLGERMEERWGRREKGRESER